MEKIKVVHLITLLELGGAQGNTLYTVEHLDVKKFDAHLWTGKGGYWDDEINTHPFLKTRLKYFSFLIRQLNPFLDFLGLIEIFIALKKTRPHIIHTHSSKAGILGRIAAKLTRIPVIIHTYHGFGFNEEQKPWTKWLFIYLERIVAKFSHKLIFVSKANMNLAQKHQIGNVEKSLLIRSGIPIKSIQQRARICDPVIMRERLSIPPNKKIIVTIGPFKPQKNLSDFIAIAKKIIEMEPNSSFLIIGDGEQRSKLEKLISDSQLNDRVKLLGWRRDVPEILSISDVFVLTSLWEGLPRALLEAMAVGVPSVCYDTDGIRDVLSFEPKNIIPHKNIQMMKDRILEILNGEQNATDLSKTSKNLITNEFDIDDMVYQQEQLYESMVWTAASE